MRDQQPSRPRSPHARGSVDLAMTFPSAGAVYPALTLFSEETFYFLRDGSPGSVVMRRGGCSVLGRR